MEPLLSYSTSSRVFCCLAESDGRRNRSSVRRVGKLKQRYTLSGSDEIPEVCLQLCQTKIHKDTIQIKKICSNFRSCRVYCRLVYIKRSSSRIYDDDASLEWDDPSAPSPWASMPMHWERSQTVFSTSHLSTIGK